MNAKSRGWTVDTNREVKGYYCMVQGKHYIILDDAEIKPIDPDMGGWGDGISGFVEVCGESVGQFTGECSEGQEIYAGDIIDKEWVVRFYDGHFVLCNPTDKPPERCAKEEFSHLALKDSKITGNIHNLLEGK